MVRFDASEWKARLIPGLLALLPIPILVVVLGLRQQPVVATIAGLLIAVGLPVLLTSTVRDRGLRLQDVLYAKWGGAPTTECLRHSGTSEDAPRREQWRREVIKVVAHSLPTVNEEHDDQVAADGRYRAAIAETIEATRGKFPLVFEENQNYGFERNLLAMRPIGIWVGAVGILAGACAAIPQGVWSCGLSLIRLVIGLLAMTALLALWLFLPTEGRVRRIGRRYA